MTVSGETAALRQAQGRTEWVGSLMACAFHDTGLNEDIGVDEQGGYRPSSS